MTRAMIARRRVLVLSLAVVGLVSACSAGAKRPDQTPAAQSPASFVNRVWRVASSSSIEPGALYVFLSDGTLVISSPHGTPAFGTWKQDGSGLTMSGLILIEDGRSYKVNVLKLSADEFRIMINNPGNAVEIAFAPADDARGASAIH